MSKIEKLLLKIRQNPKTVSFSDLDKVLQWYGFACRQRSGGSSHYVYTLTFGKETYRLTVPYKRPHVKQIYVKQVLEILDEIEVNDSEVDDEQ